MTSLMDRVGSWVKYRLLTNQDRQSLLREGFAQDLVDNLVYYTERTTDTTDFINEEFVTGFTQAAFDPSIYASEAMIDALRASTHGNCAWCEQPLENAGAIVSHIRPPAGYIENSALYREAYYDLAYKHTNLIYSCPSCSNRYKANHFPVLSSFRGADDSPVLVDPYNEDPRDFIRFNPCNGMAYPYDRLHVFIEQQNKFGNESPETVIWNDPSLIPAQFDSAGNSISNSDNEQEYRQWCNSSSAPEYSRGESTIQILGLNRSTLQRFRIAHLQRLQALWTISSETENDEKNKNEQNLEAARKTVDAKPLSEFSSLTIDAQGTWDTGFRTENSIQLPESSQDTQLTVVPESILTGLVYIVLENELSLVNKRRIIHLSADDLLYSSVTSKCVCMPINWTHDFNNVIKVHSDNQTWETSFAELIATRHSALRTLFSNNEVWAEGQYAALSSDSA